MRIHSRSGWTLIELLGVLLILSILAFFLITRLGNTEDTVKARLARTQIETIATALTQYETDKGDYPPSSFKPEWGSPPNALNLGSECLYLSLWQKGVGGGGLKEEDLVNLDGDATSKRLTENASLDLFEIRDPWGNPIAYFHRRDYSRKDHYLTLDPKSGESVDSEVSAKKSSKTGSYFQPHTFQLISAGIDGKFGTDDDIGNFSDKQ